MWKCNEIQVLTTDPRWLELELVNTQKPKYSGRVLAWNYVNQHYIAKSLIRSKACSIPWYLILLPGQNDYEQIVDLVVCDWSIRPLLLWHSFVKLSDSRYLSIIIYNTKYKLISMMYHWGIRDDNHRLCFIYSVLSMGEAELSYHKIQTYLYLHTNITDGR